MYNLILSTIKYYYESQNCIINIEWVIFMSQRIFDVLVLMFLYVSMIYTQEKH